MWEFATSPPLLRFDERSRQPIQSARAGYDLCAAFSEHDRSHLAYAAARTGDYEGLIFDSLHEVLLSQKTYSFVLLVARMITQYGARTDTIAIR
jgi:hypothetical protein